MKAIMSKNLRTIIQNPEGYKALRNSLLNLIGKTTKKTASSEMLLSSGQKYKVSLVRRGDKG